LCSSDIFAQLAEQQNVKIGEILAGSLRSAAKKTKNSRDLQQLAEQQNVKIGEIPAGSLRSAAKKTKDSRDLQQLAEQQNVKIGEILAGSLRSAAKKTKNSPNGIDWPSNQRRICRIMAVAKVELLRSTVSGRPLILRIP
jgi:glucose/arabinose dehydrogenase